MTLKVLYFIEGISPTVEEAAEIASIEALCAAPLELGIRSNTALAQFGDDRAEPCDLVAGTLPASGLFDEVELLDPDNLPETGVEANQYVLTDGDVLTDDSGVLATGSVNFAGQPTTLDTVVIGGKTYRFISVLAQANDIFIGASAAATRDNLVAAINLAAGIGVKYGTGTTANDDVTAVASGANAAITARADTNAGDAGNSVPLTESATNVTVTGAGTLSGGVDAQTVTVSIAAGVPTYHVN